MRARASAHVVANASRCVVERVGEWRRARDPNDSRARDASSTIASRASRSVEAKEKIAPRDARAIETIARRAVDARAPWSVRKARTIERDEVVREGGTFGRARARAARYGGKRERWD